MRTQSLIPILAALFLPLAAAAGSVNINTADAQTLARELDGIGLARAKAIVEYREKNGPFKSAADLAKVKNIPMKVVEKNRDNIQVGGGQAGGKPPSGRGEKAGKDAAAEPDNSDS